MDTLSTRSRLSGVHPASFNPGDNDDDEAFRPRRRSNSRHTTTDTLNQTRSSETNSSPDSSVDTVDSVDDKKDPPWSPLLETRMDHRTLLVVKKKEKRRREEKRTLLRLRPKLLCHRTRFVVTWYAKTILHLPLLRIVGQSRFCFTKSTPAPSIGNPKRIFTRA
jgi:hypothetical protein